MKEKVYEKFINKQTNTDEIESNRIMEYV